MSGQAGGPPVERKDRGHNYDAVAELVAGRVEKTQALHRGFSILKDDGLMK